MRMRERIIMRVQARGACSSVTSLARSGDLARSRFCENKVWRIFDFLNEFVDF